MIHEILNELNESNSTNHKLAVLQKHKDNMLLQEVLKMTYDKVVYTYGMSLNTIESRWKTHEPRPKKELGEFLEFLDEYICTGRLTGHEAIDEVVFEMNGLSDNDLVIAKNIINRDLKINVGKTQINKVWKGLIVKPAYMRCDVYGEKTAKKIIYPAMIQLKADGTYREFSVHNVHVTSRSRSGESYEYPTIFKDMSNYKDGVYTGELTVKGVTDRAFGNGMINSDDVPHDRLLLELWDYVTHEEYQNSITKGKNTTPYIERFEELQLQLRINRSTNISLIPYKKVDSLKEALEQVSAWMTKGYEGGVLKNLNGVFKDGTSKDQLKLKLQIDAEMRITDFHDGKPGTKREGKVGSLIFENDEGTIKGRCSGFTDKELDDMTNNPNKYLGKVFTVQFNDLSKGRNNDYYALSHPRFIEIRNDKDETDTLEKVMKLREMAMMLDES